MPDVSDVAFSDAVVDEVGIEVRKVERCDRLHQEHQQDQSDLAFVRRAIFLQDLGEHAPTLLLDSERFS